MAGKRKFRSLYAYYEDQFLSSDPADIGMMNYMYHMMAAARRVDEEDGITECSAGLRRPAKRARTSRSRCGFVCASAPEKRLHRTRTQCPKAVMERVKKFGDERRFLVARRKRDEGDEEGPEEEFDVRDSVNNMNVYTVVIAKEPSCTCPDAEKGNHCKHMLFVLLKVLQIPQYSGLWYQKALLSSEVEEIFSSAPQAPTAVATEGSSTGKVAKSAPKSNGKGKAKDARYHPTEGDLCPVCYETLHEVSEEEMEWCSACTKPVHGECSVVWKNASGKQGQSVSCAYCHGSRGAAPVGSSGVVAAGATATKRKQ